MKRTRKTAVRHACNPYFTQIYRQILYSNHLTFGAKCLYFAILDLPPYAEIVWSKLARKLKTHPAQVNKWKEQILALSWRIMEEKNQA